MGLWVGHKHKAKFESQIASIIYEIKFEKCGDGGCICKTGYHTKGDFEIKEESIKEGHGSV